MPTPKYFKAWIFFFLIATVGGGLIGGVVGGILGMVLGFAQVELGTIKLVGGVAGFIIGVPVSYFTFRWVVSEFIVKPLTSTLPPVPPAPPVEPPLI